jgi:hypothetical protein
MIYSGSDLKFHVECQLVGFSMEDNDFFIVIKNRWGQTRYTITKEECFRDASASQSGLMSAAHYSKLDGIAVASDSDIDEIFA